jgi:hypothetical protein
VARQEGRSLRPFRNRTAGRGAGRHRRVRPSRARTSEFRKGPRTETAHRHSLSDEGARVRACASRPSCTNSKTRDAANVENQHCGAPCRFVAEDENGYRAEDAAQPHSARLKREHRGDVAPGWAPEPGAAGTRGRPWGENVPGTRRTPTSLPRAALPAAGAPAEVV